MRLDCTSHDARRPSFTRSRFIGTAGLLGLVWLGLNGADAASWMVGAPVVIMIAAVVARRPAPGFTTVHWGQAASFAVFFLWRSLVGGWDVAWKVLRASLPIAPGYLEHETILPEGAARNLFLSTISLLPGTLTAEVQGSTVRVHCLDLGSDPGDELRRLELHVAAMFPGVVGKQR